MVEVPPRLRRARGEQSDVASQVVNTGLIYQLNAGRRMRKSGRLTNIAAGLCGSFASRNNELDGYWAIGKLRLLAEQHGWNAVLFDLLDESMLPPSPQFAPVLARYRSLLAKLADLSGVRFEQLTAACITADFAPPPWPRANYFKSEWGRQFVLTVTIRADGRPNGLMRHAGYCRPHDPASERKSARPLPTGSA